MNPNDLSFSLPQLSLESLLWNIIISIVLSCILSWHYNLRSQKTYLRRDLGFILPTICLTTVLVISVVKSSLALSLGLVGALSIVRFRTPIKEPEELAYIFLAIGIGLAMGADQREVAVMSVVIILVVMTVIDRAKKNRLPINDNLLLTMDISNEETEVKKVLSMLEEALPGANIKRIDQEDNNFSIVALVKIQCKKTLLEFCGEFQEKFPQGKFSIIDDSVYPNE